MDISASLENYLESILIIQNRKGFVRVTDLAHFTNVKAPSVIEAVNNLKKKGLVLHERYKHIELTPKGLQLAKKLYAKHLMLKKFFHGILGVDEAIAEEDACTIEHYLSKESLNKMVLFNEFVRSSQGGFQELFKQFSAFSNTHGNSLNDGPSM